MNEEDHMKTLDILSLIFLNDNNLFNDTKDSEVKPYKSNELNINFVEKFESMGGFDIVMNLDLEDKDDWSSRFLFKASN